MIFRRKPALSLVFRRLALATRTRLPLTDALRIIAEDSDVEPLTARTMSEISAQVRSGASLSDAMLKQPGLFVPETVALVRASENSDAAPVVLELLADEFEQRESYRGALRAALAWPSVSFIAFLFLLFGISAFVIPAFAEMFKSFDADLPLPTRLVLAVAGKALIWIPILAIVLYFGWRKFANLSWPDSWTVRTPVLRDYVRAAFISRFSLMLLAADAGAPMREMLAHLRATCGSPPLAAAVRSLEGRLDSGSDLAAAVHETPELPPRVRVSVELGARSGAIAEAVRQVLELNADELDRGLVRIEQFVLVLAYAIVAVLVGFMVIALYLPIFKMGSVI